MQAASYFLPSGSNALAVTADPLGTKHARRGSNVEHSRSKKMANPNSPGGGMQSDEEDRAQSGLGSERAGFMAQDSDNLDDSAKWEDIEAGIEELRARVAEAQVALQSLAGDVMAAGRDTAASVEDTVRQSIERQPYTAVLIAALIGFVIGSMNANHRRY
jgi:ElaB/YqjD/DUF883 family membrane-anchored ribosome-binding protein